MSEILFLSHRIPYPPDKGDKIRSYHVLRALAARHTVHVGTFVDDDADREHEEAVRRLCGGEVCVRPLAARAARLRSARGLLTGQPLTLAYYADAVLARWVQDLGTRRRLTGVYAFSSAMGPYAERAAIAPGGVRLMDFCDVDSDKWRQYAADHRPPMSVVYSREARTLAAVEEKYVRRFDGSLVVSGMEAEILRRIAPGDGGRIRVVPNGVDTDYFNPALPFDDPFAAGTLPVVFTGAMDYHANVDAVQWFAREVFPAVRRQRPACVFAIVGSNPTAEIRSLAALDGVIVTGRVADVRPYLAHASAVVAPLRIARGVQNKVLEALAMARPVIATENAVQGIPDAASAGVRVEGDAVGLARAVVEAVDAGGENVRGRAFASARYSWAAHLAPVLEIFARAPQSRVAAPHDTVVRV